MTAIKFENRENLILDYCSDQITKDLIQRLKTVMSSGLYCNYLHLAGVNGIRHELNIEGQLAFFCETFPDINRLKAIRQASETWNNLDLIYRLTVLDAFSTVFYDRLQQYNPTERTIIFCQIFINDLVDVLTSH